MADATFWLRLAQERRATAKAVKDPGLRAALLEIAANYERMASPGQKSEQFAPDPAE